MQAQRKFVFGKRASHCFYYSGRRSRYIMFGIGVFVLHLLWLPPLAAEEPNKRPPFFDASAMTLLRYENETGSNMGVKDRERIRAIVKLDLSLNLSGASAIKGRLRSGDKFKSSAPAITVKPLDSNKTGRQDAYLEQLYFQHVFSKQHALKLGQQPMALAMNTDLIWDKDIPVLGLSYAYKKNNAQYLSLQYSRVNEAQGHYIGKLASADWRLMESDLGKLRFGLLHYQGEEGAEYLKKDTDHDASIVSAAFTSSAIGTSRLSTFIDIFHNTQSPELNVDERTQFNGSERSAFTLGAKAPLFHTRLKALYQYIYVERFASLSGFAQNGVSRVGTTNIQGHVLQLMYKPKKQHTLRFRLTDTEEIVGDEAGLRLRLDYIWRL